MKVCFTFKFTVAVEYIRKKELTNVKGFVGQLYKTIIVLKVKSWNDDEEEGLGFLGHCVFNDALQAIPTGI